MIRSKGEAGTGNIVEAVRHMRSITSEIKRLHALGPEELAAAAKEHRARSTSSATSRSAAGCRCRCSAPAASRPRPTRR